MENCADDDDCDGDFRRWKNDEFHDTEDHDDWNAASEDESLVSNKIGATTHHGSSWPRRHFVSTIPAFDVVKIIMMPSHRLSSPASDDDDDNVGDSAMP